MKDESVCFRSQIFVIRTLIVEEIKPVSKSCCIEQGVSENSSFVFILRLKLTYQILDRQTISIPGNRFKFLFRLQQRSEGLCVQYVHHRTDNIECRNGILRYLFCCTQKVIG